MGDQASGKVLTLAKTCEEVEYIRTGKAHYLVICTCPDSGFLEGPLAQTGAPYAKVPGIRVFGMLCLSRGRGRPKRRKAKMLWGQQEEDVPTFPDVPQHL